MGPLRGLTALAFGSLLLTGVSAGYVYEELSGQIGLEGGESVVEVPLLLRVTNVREDIGLVASCRLRSPSGHQLAAELGGGESGAANEGVLNLRIPPAWETRQIRLTLRCRSDDDAEDSEIFSNIRARARPRGGCTLSGCIGPQSRMSVEIGR